MEQNDFLKERIDTIRQNILRCCDKMGTNSTDINLMAVTKTIPYDTINLAINHGICLLGENRVQEFLEKAPNYLLQKSAIHFIGHLQTNKVKYIIDKVSMIESVGSLKLAEEIDRQALLHNLNMDILLEINIAGEPTKSGFLPQEVFAAADHINALKNVRLCGMMSIPPKENSSYYFDSLHSLFQSESQNSNMRWLSMGMSNDYEAAILHGANIVRLGNAIFGQREH